MTTKYKLVPIEPTEEMLKAGCEAENKYSERLAWSDFDNDYALKLAYKAMLEAAPSQDSEPVAQVVLNIAGQITIQTANGDYFDISKHIGDKFYTHAPADKADAERYRWLRNKSHFCSDFNAPRISDSNSAFWSSGEALDKAIDKARSKS